MSWCSLVEFVLHVTLGLIWLLVCYLHMLLAVSLWFQSRSRTFSSRMFVSLRSSGNFVFSSLPNMRHAGVTPVLACGVVVYANKKLHELSFPSRSFHMSHFEFFQKCSVLSLHLPICLWPQRWRYIVFDSMFH